MPLKPYLLFFMFFLTLSCAGQPASGNDQVDTFEFPGGKNSVLSAVYLFEDESGALSLSEIRKAGLDDKFRKVPLSSMDRIAVGLSGSTWWVRLHLNTELLTGPSVLAVDFSLLEEVGLSVADGEDLIIQRSGISVPDLPIDVVTRFPVFPLTGHPRDSVIYLKVRSHGPILLPIRIEREREFFSSELTTNLLFGVFFGIIFLVLCYNLILCIITRESTYFFYLIYVFFLGIVLLNYFGFSYVYFWPQDVAWIEKVMPACIILVNICLTNFMRHFFNTSVNFPILNKVFLSFMGAYGILFLGLPFFPASLFYRLSAPGSTIIMILVVITLVKSYRKNFAPATYMLVGWLFVFTGVISLVGKTFGWIPYNSFTSFFILIGVVVEVIMFTIGLGYRYRWLKKETAKMTEELAVRHAEMEVLRDKIAGYIMDGAPNESAIPITISKDDINSYLRNELTERELNVLYRVAEGLSNKEIGEQLFISTNTVRAHMRNIYDKLHVKNRTEAVFKANQLKLMTTKA